MYIVLSVFEGAATSVEPFESWLVLAAHFYALFLVELGMTETRGLT
jgi:hypothetical protein